MDPETLPHILESHQNRDQKELRRTLDHSILRNPCSQQGLDSHVAEDLASLNYFSARV